MAIKISGSTIIDDSRNIVAGVAATFTGNVIVGSPSTVTEKLREAITKLRVGHMMLLCQFGDMPKELTNQNTALFAEEVMPNLRDIWKDYEDHWWPKPISENDRVYPDRKA